MTGHPNRGRRATRRAARPATRHATRLPARGFVLPFVLIAVTAASLIAFAFTAEGLQGLRGQRAAEQGASVASAADAAIAHALDDFTADSLWRLPLGVPHPRTMQVNGVAVAVQWQRHQPLFASLRARARTSAARRLDVAEREHYRAVWLAPPPVPVIAALASTGPVTGGTGTLVSGSDLALPGSACGTSRDTASVAAVAAPAITGEAPNGWPGAPMAVPIDTGFPHEVRAALALIEGRLPVTITGRLPRAFPAARAWTALHLQGDTVTVAGPTRWTGLVVVRGHFVVTGTVQVTGVLLVDGGLDASAAQLSVQGAVLSADTSARGVMLGARSRLFYDRCAVQMALATVARPSLAPFSLWESLGR